MWSPLSSFSRLSSTQKSASFPIFQRSKRLAIAWCMVARNLPKSSIINGDFLETFESLNELAPLHNPANLMGVEAATTILPNVPQCAIMDTAWHQTMPAQSYMYALPREWYEKYMVRRYGFHGTSFLYNAKRAAVLLGKDPSRQIL